MKTNHTRQKGFTLIEVIVTLVIAALMGAVIFAYMGPTLTRSHEPITHVENLGAAKAIMEEVTVRYQDYLLGNDDWGTFIGWLQSRNDIQQSDVSGPDDLGTDFDALEVTVTVGQQTVSALFTEY